MGHNGINGFQGAVWQPGESGYEQARLPWQRAVDPLPALVAAASSATDVRLALLAARERGLPFAVQGTGHGAVVAADGALLLRTSALSDVEVDPVRRSARVGAGAIFSDVIAEAARYGLAPLSGTGSIGVAGYTLGGGAGWLSRAHGYAADSLLRAELVTADGHALSTDAQQHPDLFWALRGGGGNFGALTALEFRLYPVGRVYAGMSLYGIDRAADTLATYARWAGTEPDELNTALVVLRTPDDPALPEPVRGRQVLGLRVFSLASERRTHELLAPVLAAAGPALLPGFAERDFVGASTALGGPPAPPMAFAQRFELLPDLPAPALDVLLDAAENGLTIEVRHWAGAMARPGADAGPVGHRDVPFSVLGTSAYATPEDGERVRAGLAALGARLRPYTTGGTFLNFLTDPTRTASAYPTEAYRRLGEVKRVWDPDNVFRLNHNIPPATG